MAGKTLLRRGVIARTIQEWLSKPLDSKREAERYEDFADLSLVCSLAGISVLNLRKCLNIVRIRALPGLMPIAAWATQCDDSPKERNEKCLSSRNAS